MRILAIRGENIASLAGSFELRLADGPLGATGLFAITGPTGSGKSSLLDAMCLALFDKTPRLNNQGGTPIGPAELDEKKRIRSNDPCGLLTRGAGAGFAEVDFRGRDGQTYRAKWAIRRARLSPTGNFRPLEWTLTNLDTGDDLSRRKKADMRSVVEERLGLSFAQFGRSVLLAQGQFAAFLQAGGSGRASLLERMTGTEIYARISKAAFSRAKDEDQRLDDLERTADLVGVLEPDRRLPLEQEAKALGKARQKLEQAHQTLEKAQSWYAELDGKTKDAGEAATVVASALLAWRGFVPPEEELPEPGDLDAVGELARAARPRLQEAFRQDATLDSLQANIQEVKTRLAEAEGLEAEARAELGRLGRLVDEGQTTLDGLDEWLEERAQTGKLAKHQALYESKLEDFATARKEQRSHEEALTTVNAELTDARKRAAGAAAEQASALKQLTDAKTVAKQADAALEAFPVAGLRGEVQELRDRSDTLRDFAEQQRAYVDTSQKRDKLAEKLVGAKAALTQLTKSIERASEELTTAKAELGEAQRTLRRMEDELSFEDRRSTLTEGNPCPLCGAREHPYACEGAATENLVTSQRHRVGELEETVEEKSRLLGELRGTLASQEKSHGEDGESHGKLVEALAVLETEWADLCRAAKLDLPPVTDELAEARLGDHLAATKQAMAAAVAKEKELEALGATAAAARKNRDALQADLDGRNEA